MLVYWLKDLESSVEIVSESLVEIVSESSVEIVLKGNSLEDALYTILSLAGRSGKFINM